MILSKSRIKLIIRLIVYSSIVIFILIYFVRFSLYPSFAANRNKLPEVTPKPFNDLFLKNENTGDQIHAWYSIKDKLIPTVIYFHGNGENIAGMNKSGQLHEFAHLLNSNFIVFDYPSYGKSSGSPNEKYVVDSAKQIVNWVKTNYPDSPIIIWGRSLGAGVASQIIQLENKNIERFVLVSPWYNFYELGHHHAPILAKILPSFIVNQNIYNSNIALSENKKPGLIIIAEKDKIIPARFSQKLIDELNDPNIKSITIKNVGHNGIYIEEALKHILSFLSE